MLWSWESVPATASGAASFADPALKAGEQVAMTSSQSEANVTQPATESKPAGKVTLMAVSWTHRSCRTA